MKRSKKYLNARTIALGALATVLLTSGVSYAANEWTGANIVNGSLTNVDLANETVTGSKILNSTITAADIKNGTIGDQDLGADSVDSSKVLDNSLTGNDVADNTLGTLDIATDAIDSDEILDFGLSNEDVAVLGAAVNSDGTLHHAQGFSVTSSHIGTGNYQVDFGRDVSFCVYSATIGTPTAGNAPAGFIDVSPRSGLPTAVFVDIHNAANTAGQDSPFHLTVVC